MTVHDSPSFLPQFPRLLFLLTEITPLTKTRRSLICGNPSLEQDNDTGSMRTKELLELDKDTWWQQSPGPFSATRPASTPAQISLCSVLSYISSCLECFPHSKPLQTPLNTVNILDFSLVGFSERLPWPLGLTTVPPPYYHFRAHCLPFHTGQLPPRCMQHV